MTNDRTAASASSGVRTGPVGGDLHIEARRDVIAGDKFVFNIQQTNDGRFDDSREARGVPGAAFFPKHLIGHDFPQTTTQVLLGRTRELVLLDKAWSSNQPASTRQIRFVSIVGWGGQGKTALVLEWLDQFKARKWDGLDRVCAWSFHGAGLHARPAGSDEFISATLEWLGETSPGSYSATKGQRVAELLTEGRNLLVLDGIESLQRSDGQIADPAVAELIRQLAWQRSQTLCIITSRLRPVELDGHRAATTSIDLPSLSPAS